ncbi:MAG TPA: hypothetical protein G4N92_07650 [Anaerolineae bacterium]|nr:hypothetical protein [Anaerolineae bacterium]
MSKLNKKIPTKISPDILDTIGKSFKFNHGKGISEWLKNSLDNYLRLYESGQETLQGNWPVVINLINTKNQKIGPNLAVIDFGGTTLQNINEFLLYWGYTKAATLGGKSKVVNLTGAHGNGGKFYMREMWRDGARFLTWREGLATSLIVDKSLEDYTGEWELQDCKMSWKNALNFALNTEENLQGTDWIINYLDTHNKQLISEIEQNGRGFSIVVGRKAVQIHPSNDVVRGGKWNSQSLVDSIRSANQARRPLRELSISLFIDGNLKLERLSTEGVPLDSEWEELKINVPDSAIKDIAFKSKSGFYGNLVIKKSSQQLTGRYKKSNILIVNDVNKNPIGFYSISELPLMSYSSLQNFIFGELTLNFPNLDKLISNDREKLINSPTTKSLIEWVAKEIWNLINSYEEKQKKEKKKEELNIAEKLNDALNNHAKRFLKELESRIMVDFIDDPFGGGKGDVGKGTTTKGDGTIRDDTPRDFGSGGEGGKGGTKEINGTLKRKRKLKFPRVLLSELHEDPSKSDGTSKHLTNRHPPIHQDDIDKQYNVWWINTNHPYSQQVLLKSGAESIPFKQYHLFLFVQVIQVESLRILQRRQSELGLDIVENHLSDITNKFLAELPVDLVNTLIA